MKRIPHTQTIENVARFADVFECTSATKKNVHGFLHELLRIDPLHKTQFELSFKVGNDILNRGEIRILNLDIDTYSHRSSELYMLRLEAYKKIMARCKNPKKEKIFQALELLKDAPLDLYAGADINNDEFFFAFWLILGGVKPNGDITYTTKSVEIYQSLLKQLNMEGNSKLAPKDILNVGFDIGKEEIYQKIYYFLNEYTKSFISKKEYAMVKYIDIKLADTYRHWFFVSERYIIDKPSKKPERKKIYLEFLDYVDTKSEKTFAMLSEVFKIIGCSYDAFALKKYLGVLDARIVIIAFEESGTVTFYVRC